MISVMMPHNLYLMSGVVDDVDPSIEHKGQLSFLNNEVDISHIFHYEDLILCILKDVITTIFWNPYLALQLYFSTMINMILSFEIRITTKIEVKMVSWSKFLRMDTGSKIVNVLAPELFRMLFKENKFSQETGIIDM
ncbi:putative F-box associated domain, type 1 [Arabidopsis thaliana]